MDTRKRLSWRSEALCQQRTASWPAQIGPHVPFLAQANRRIAVFRQIFHGIHEQFHERPPASALGESLGGRHAGTRSRIESVAPVSDIYLQCVWLCAAFDNHGTV